MAGTELDFEEACEQLLVWTRSLLLVSESHIPQMREALDPASALTSGCPSHASMALMIFREVREKLDEVQAAVDAVDKAIRAADI